MRCYGCGQPWSKRAEELMARIETEGETAELVESLNRENTEHVECFE
jgi:DNA-directed RNA polymerase subunit N (RpoN/RPB10)